MNEFLYNIKAHPTRYVGVLFRSRLEARWAAFFDIVKWKWEYEPIDLVGWSPDFRVEFPCGHSGCNGSHTLLVEVKPYFDINDFKGHPCLDYPFGSKWIGDDSDGCEKIPADASAAFGANPRTTYWEMTHGHGGGCESVPCWFLGDIDSTWDMAGEIVQWNPPLQDRRRYVAILNGKGRLRRETLFLEGR